MLLTKSSQQELLKDALDKFDKKYPITPQLIKKYDSRGNGVFHLACQTGQFDRVCDLLKQEDIDVNQMTNQGITALLIAC
ncbi:MAG: hypothetical protein HYX60_09475, partial [Legionella longbeachae]|nr:hypothetical protein [Legionella longbeachae]